MTGALGRMLTAWIAILWVAFVMAAHVSVNFSYYAEKVSTFGHFIFR
jgi:hypothetical protein